MFYYSIQAFTSSIGDFVQVKQAKTIKECIAYINDEFNGMDVKFKLEKRKKMTYSTDKIVEIIELQLNNLNFRNHEQNFKN